ncbi:MAG TPA: UrcA family protein [Caulobacteraceae bacterium]|nr:UrcA family protein [Caulobacteraceae bacterium]
MVMNTRCSVIFAAIFAALAATPAFAGDQSRHRDVQTTSVSARDLDLKTEAGAKVLLRRIYTAAHEVCGDQPALTEIESLRMHNHCVLDAVDRAIAALDFPSLTALNSQVRKQTTFIH